MPMTKEALLEKRLAKMRQTPQCHASSKQDGGHSLAYRNYGERCDWCAEEPPEEKPQASR